MSKEIKRLSQVLPAHSETSEEHLKIAGKVRKELWLSLTSGTASPQDADRSSLSIQIHAPRMAL